MIRKGTQRLGDLLEQFQEQPGVDKRLKQMAAIEELYRVLGAARAGYVYDAQFRGTTLYVSLRSAPLKSELFMEREEIRTAINRKVGGEIIAQINFR